MPCGRRRVATCFDVWMSTPPAEPDPRFLLANERTYLAWIRTALGLIAGGLALPHLLSEPDSFTVRVLLGVPLLALGAVTVVWSTVWWRSREQALRAGRPLPTPRFIPFLSTVIAAAACAAIILVLLRGS